MNHARQLAEQYLAHVNAADLDRLAGLFADDAVVMHPAGTFQGPEAIRGFYAENVLVFHPTITATSWLGNGDRCVFEMEGRVAGADMVQYAIDHLTAVGERIGRLAIYYR